MAKRKTQTKKQSKTKEMGKIFHKKTEVDGIIFDSQTEAEYYLHLKELHNSKKILAFTRQDEFILQEKYIIVDGKRINGSDPGFKKAQRENPGQTIQAIKYRSDFIIHHLDGTKQVVDVKGLKTADFKIKEKMFNYMYPEYNKLYCVVKYNGQWMEYKEAEKIKKMKKKQQKK